MLGRLRNLTAQELSAQELILEELRRRGPLWTMYRIARRERGGPFTQAAYNLLPIPSRALANIWVLRSTAVAVPFMLGWASLALLNWALVGSDVALPAVVAAVIAVVGLAATGWLVLIALKATRGRFLRYVRTWSHEDLVLWALTLLVLPTVAFAVVSAFLIDQHALGFKGVEADSTILAYKTCETYAWNLADAVPILEVPETLSWTPDGTFSTPTGRGLVLAYKVLLVVPFVQLGAIALARSFGDNSVGGAGGAEAVQTSPNPEPARSERPS